MAHITARIPDEHYQAIKDIAELEMRSFNQVFSFAIKEYIEKHAIKKPAKKNAQKVQK